MGELLEDALYESLRNDDLWRAMDQAEGEVLYSLPYSDSYFEAAIEARVEAAREHLAVTKALRRAEHADRLLHAHVCDGDVDVDVDVDEEEILTVASDLHAVGDAIEWQVPPEPEYMDELANRLKSSVNGGDNV